MAGAHPGTAVALTGRAWLCRATSACSRRRSPAFPPARRATPHPPHPARLDSIIPDVRPRCRGVSACSRRRSFAFPPAHRATLHPPHPARLDSIIPDVRPRCRGVVATRRGPTHAGRSFRLHEARPTSVGRPGVRRYCRADAARPHLQDHLRPPVHGRGADALARRRTCMARASSSMPWTSPGCSVRRSSR